MQKLSSANDNPPCFSSIVRETLAPERLWLDGIPTAPASSVDPRMTDQWPECRKFSGDRPPIRDKLKETQTWPDSKRANLSALDPLPTRPTRLRKLFPSRRKVDTGPVCSGPIPPQQLTKRNTINKLSRRGGLAGFYDETEKAPFACPFYMHQPGLHEDCRHYVLKRIKDVRQHIARKHKDGSQPNWESSDQTQLKVSPQQWDWITQQAADPSNKTKSPKEQWISIWEILFPETLPPSSVSLSNETPPDEAQTLRRLRKFWLSKCDDIIKNTMQQAEPVLENQPDRIFLDQLVECFLGQFEAEMAGSSSEETTQVNPLHQAPFHPHSAQAMATSLATGAPSIPGMQCEDYSSKPVYYDPYNEYEEEWEETPFAPDRQMPLFQSPHSSTVSLTNTTASRLSYSSTFSALPLSYNGFVSGEDTVYYDERESWKSSGMNLDPTSFPATEGYPDGNFHDDFQQSSNRHTWPVHTTAASMEWFWNEIGDNGRQ